MQIFIFEILFYSLLYVILSLERRNDNLHNLVYLIGRLASEPEVKQLDDDRSTLSINIAVQRSFKNEEGLYEVDFIRCILWNGVAVHTSEYCHKGDLVGVKGRLQTRSYEKDDEVKYITEVIVDKISFLSSKKIEDDMNEVEEENE